MKTIKQYTVDAFTNQVFSGNPAAVCLLNQFPPDELMCRIAAENNLSETAFVVPQGEDFALRWFTPKREIDLCGHVTLATAFVIDRFVPSERSEWHFHTRGGVLTVCKENGQFAMNFPAFPLKPVAIPTNITDVLGCTPKAAYMGRDLLCVFEDEAQIRAIKPDFAAMLELDGELLHVTAPGKDYDCVSRSFAPKYGVAEDPVCGTGHCHIFPYWAEQLSKMSLSAIKPRHAAGCCTGSSTAGASS